MKHPTWLAKTPKVGEGSFAHRAARRVLYTDHQISKESRNDRLRVVEINLLHAKLKESMTVDTISGAESYTDALSGTLVLAEHSNPGIRLVPDKADLVGLCSDDLYFHHPRNVNWIPGAVNAGKNTWSLAVVRPCLRALALTQSRRGQAREDVAYEELLEIAGLNDDDLAQLNRHAELVKSSGDLETSIPW